MGPGTEGTTTKSSKADVSMISPPSGVKRACSVLESILSGRNLTVSSTNTNGTALRMKLEKPFPPSVGLAPIGISIGFVHGMFEPSVSPTKSVLLVPSATEPGLRRPLHEDPATPVQGNIVPGPEPPA